MKANLFIIGAGKSATTSLWEFLSQHPQACMCPTKEPSFFSNTIHFKRGENWYHNLYDNYRQEDIIGEASNSYSATGTYPETPARIFNYNPNSKLIYIVRHPIERTESDWIEANKRATVEFGVFIRNDKLCSDKNNYLKQYKAYLKYFSRNSILVLTFEQVTNNSDETKTIIFDFLGIEYCNTEVVTKRSTAGQKKRTKIFYMINQSNLYARVRRYVPKPARRLANKLTSIRYTAIRPIWTTTDRTWFEQAYRKPTEEFFANARIKLPNWKW